MTDVTTGVSVGSSSDSPDGLRTIRSRFWRVYVALGIVIVVGATFVLLAVRDRNEAVYNEGKLWRPGQIAAVEVLTAAIDQETGIRGFVITGNDSFLDPYTAGRQRSAEALTILHSLFRNHPDITERVDAAATNLTEWQIRVAEPLIAATRDDPALARDIINQFEDAPTLEGLRTSLAELSAAIDSRWADSNAQRARAFTTLALTTAIASAILVGLTIALLDRSRRWLTHARTLEERLRSTITTVQASLLPTTIPDLERLAIAVSYRPASADADVGGDFYDINITPADLITISVGDVCGHDIDAAVTTGLVRHTLNAASQHLADPSAVLRWANQALNSHDADGRFVSATHAHLHPHSNDGTAEFDFALAGHPCPILIPADGRPPYEIGTPGTLLGIVTDLKLTTTRITLNPGDQVMLYTDGLTENSHPRLTAEDLLAILEDSTCDTAAGTHTELMRRYDQLDRRSRYDDVAVIVVQLRPALAGSL